MIIRQKKFHLTAFGNFSRFFEIGPGFGKIRLASDTRRRAQTEHRLNQFNRRDKIS